MNDWLKDYQKAWKTVRVDNIEQRLSKLRDLIKEDQKKDRRSTFWMTLAFLAAIAVILWVAINNDFSSITSWTAVVGMILLMLLTSFLRMKAIITTPDPRESEIDHINKLISSYTLRRRMQRQYLWFYLIVLNLMLIMFYFDSYYPNELTVLYVAVAGTLGYTFLIMLLMNKKRKRDIEFMSDVIENLKSMKHDLMTSD